MGEWEEMTWGDLATLEYGKSLRDYRNTEGEFRVYGTNGPIGWHYKPLCLHPGIIVGRKGAYRGIHFSPEPFFVIDTAFYLNPIAEFDIKWAYYQLLTKDIDSMDSGSAIPSTSRESFYNLLVKVPPIHEQRAIAHILGTLDDKIELNRRMNETLETMAQALFKSWFIDFDPVRAKMEGEPTGLPEEIEKLFPDKLVWNEELGKEVPEGWKNKTLGDLCHKPQYGFTASASLEPIGPRFLRITDINKLPWIEWKNVPYCEITSDDFTKYSISKGDILIARMADPGHGVYIEEDVDAVFASYLIRFVPKRIEIGRYIQYWLRSNVYWEIVKSRNAGTTRASINAKVLGNFPILEPEKNILIEFTKMVKSYRNLIIRNSSESTILSFIRDLLLSKLISGEIQLNPEFINSLEDNDAILG